MLEILISSIDTSSPGKNKIKTIYVIHFINGQLENFHTKNLRRKRSEIYPICTGDFNSFETILHLAKNGALGYLPYDEIENEIIPAITYVLQERVYVSPQLQPVITSYFNIVKTPVKKPDLVTRQEYKIIALLTQGALYKEIAESLQISENTVRSHVRNIYKKLCVHSKIQLSLKNI